MTALGELQHTLASACGAEGVRPGGARDAVGFADGVVHRGVVPRFVATPTSVDALGTLLRAASDAEATVLPRGAGTKLHWGNPPESLDVLVDVGHLGHAEPPGTASDGVASSDAVVRGGTRGYGGIIAHHEDDLVVTVRAGMRVHDLQHMLSERGQRLAVDPGSPNATVGGMLAAAEAGPLRMRYGAPKDLLLGVEFVRADGTVSRAGGRVVKNVAGYDLGKLLAGSWGTLGVITAATLRLQPIPASRAFVARAVSSPLEVRDLVHAVLASGVEASAIEMDLPGAGTGSLCVLLEGSPAGVAARTRQLRQLIGVDDTHTPRPSAWWGAYPFGPGDVAVRLAVPIADLHTTVYAMRDSVGSAVPVRGSAGTGVCWATLPADRAAAAIETVRTTLVGRGGSCVVVQTGGVDLDVWGPVGGLDLMHAVKSRFDPTGVFAAGRFVGGI